MSIFPKAVVEIRILAGIGNSAYYINNMHKLFFEIICFFTLC